MTLKNLLVSILALVLVASAPARAEPLKVVATFSILADLARQVGGDTVEVTALVGPDGDAHHFHPTPRDARRVAEADLVVVNGLGFEGWIDRLIASSGFHGTTVVASAGVNARKVGRASDPHAWNSVPNARIYARNIGTALAGLRPAGASQIFQTLAAYDQRLAALDRVVRTELEAVLPGRRNVITTHDSLGYFGAEYGVRFLPAAGLSTGAEPGAAAMTRLIRQIKQENVRALFVENIGDRRLIDQVARDTGAKVGGRLYTDALSPPGGGVETYEAMIRHNARLIAAALGD